MRRRHGMPFGAELADGTARFTLWAPAASSVSLSLEQESGAVSLPMDPAQDGWYSTTVKDVAAGARYAYRIDDRIDVPDPASRCNPDDVHRASELVDPGAYEWPDADWRGRPWHEAVVYELHVGTFTPAGTFNGVIERLDYLVRLGVTAVELMPVADFAGRRNWGYDGVLPFAPDAAYGTPQELKALVAAAHARGLMVVLDVVYNHFGPEGNYLREYAPQFFNPEHQTPWGAAVNFDGDDSRTVRDFFIHNALYWLEEFYFDGLRLDAVHAIMDDSRPDFVTELAARVRAGPGSARHVHLILENDRNTARYLERDEAGHPVIATAQWNDDVHHALHVLISSERDGYYVDYAGTPLLHLGRALAEGYAYQGQYSRHRGCNRGEPSAQLPPEAFVSFLQSHDQVGNRAYGERIHTYALAPALRLATICLLLAPQVPMLFMGEEFAAASPFLFFCEFSGDLARGVRDGRHREFAAFDNFSNDASARALPDPNAEETFAASKLQWDEVAETGHREWHALYGDLLEIRRKHIAHHLAGGLSKGVFAVAEPSGLAVDWTIAEGARLCLRANFGTQAWSPSAAQGRIVYATDGASADLLPPWGALWTLDRAHA